MNKIDYTKHHRGTVYNFQFIPTQEFLKKNPFACFVSFKELQQLEKRYFRLFEKYRTAVLKSREKV